MKKIILFLMLLLLQACFAPDKDSSTPPESFSQRESRAQDIYRSELQSSLQNLLIEMNIPEDLSVPIDSISEYPIYEAQINIDISSITKKIYVIDGDADVAFCDDGVLIATGYVDVSHSNDCIIVSGNGLEVSHDKDSTLLTNGYLDISHSHNSLVYYAEGSGLSERNGAWDYSPSEEEESNVDFDSVFFSQVFSSSAGSASLFE